MHHRECTALETVPREVAVACNPVLRNALAQQARFLHGVNDTWKTFEEITHHLQQDLAPDARISHDEKLRGKSGAEHQCDVVLRRPVGQLTFTCVIECKDHSNPVGSELMRAFIGKMLDLPDVHQGIMVAATGFTSDALKLAVEHRIKTYTLIDATHVRWRHEALLPIAFISVNLAGASIQFRDLQGNPRFYSLADGSPVPDDKMYLRELATGSYRPMREVLETLWDEMLDQCLPNPGDVVRTVPGQFQCYLAENGHEDVTLEVQFTPRITYYYNTISLARIQAFMDEQDQTLIPGTYETTPLDISNIIKNWPSTTQKSQVPFTPIDFFYLLGFIRRKPRTPLVFTILRSREDIDGAIPI